MPHYTTVTSIGEMLIFTQRVRRVAGANPFIPKCHGGSLISEDNLLSVALPYSINTLVNPPVKTVRQFFLGELLLEHYWLFNTERSIIFYHKAKQRN